MTEIGRLSRRSDRIELDFVERERTPRELMKLGIRLHLAVLSFSNTIVEIEKFGVERSRKAVHEWIQKADLQSATDAKPNHIVLDETVIRINSQQFWLYAAVDPKTHKFLHVRLFTTTTTVSTQRFLQELQENHDVSDAVFLVDHAKDLAAALRRMGLRFHPVRHGNRNAVERVFREVKRRTSSFGNSFGHVAPTTAETWLQAFAVRWNSLNYIRWRSSTIPVESSPNQHKLAHS